MLLEAHQPAFPLDTAIRTCYGMTLRDYFASQALTAISGSPTDRAKWAYEVADAMLVERSKK